MERTMTTEEMKVLETLEENTYRDGEKCIGFSWMIEHTKLTRKEIQKACKSLREAGLIEFYRGLFTEDGKVAGSGYCISRKGNALLKPCEVCGDEITYEWDEDANGKNHWDKGFDEATAKKRRFCEQHYQERKKTPPRRDSGSAHN